VPANDSVGLSQSDWNRIQNCICVCKDQPLVSFSFFNPSNNPTKMEHQKENGKPTADPKVKHFYNQVNELTHTCQCEQDQNCCRPYFHKLRCIFRRLTRSETRTSPMAACVACWSEKPSSGELKKSKRVWYGLCKQGGDSHNHNGSLNGYIDTENRNQKTKCFSISDLCPSSPESPEHQKPSKSPQNGVLCSLSNSINKQNTHTVRLAL